MHSWRCRRGDSPRCPALYVRVLYRLHDLLPGGLWCVGAVPVFLVWLYLVWLFVMAGAVVASGLPD